MTVKRRVWDSSGRVRFWETGFKHSLASGSWAAFTVSIWEMFGNLTHQFLGMVHKQPPQSKSHAQNPSPRWHRLEGTGREGRGYRGRSATFVIVYEAQAGTGSPGLGGRGGERPEEPKRSKIPPGAPGHRSGHRGPVSPQETRGPRPSPELHRRYFQPRNQPGFPWTP